MLGFGSKVKSALFGSHKPAKWPSQYQQCLASYRSAAFPVGVPPDAISGDSSETHCHINAPFACAQEAAALRQYIAEQLQRDVRVDIDVTLQESPRLKAIKHIILVASGKGGVGKSTCAVNMALALRREGAKVGILDADIYGPSIPLLLGLQGEKPQAKDENTLLPFEVHGIKAQSIGFLVDPDDATVWRGPMASQALSQLLMETDWGELDYLLVDMPPGTGDIQLTMSQKVPASAAIIVTTPQDLALADAHKGVKMFEKVNVPILGLIENMSQFQCPHCGETSHIFGADGAQQLAQHYGVPILAQLPLEMGIRQCSEQGADLGDEYPELGHYFAHAARISASELYYQQGAKQRVEIIFTDD